MECITIFNVFGERLFLGLFPLWGAEYMITVLQAKLIPSVDLPDGKTPLPAWSRKRTSPEAVGLHVRGWRQPTRAYLTKNASGRPLGRRTPAGADKFPRSGRKPLTGAFIRLSGTCMAKACPNAPQDGERRPAWTSFRVRDENPLQGVLFAF